MPTLDTPPAVAGGVLPWLTIDRLKRWNAIAWAFALTLAALIGPAVAVHGRAAVAQSPALHRAVKSYGTVVVGTERILIVGDSIPAGYVDGQMTPGMVPTLTGRLGAAGYVVAVDNIAVPGSRVRDWVSAPTKIRAPGSVRLDPLAARLHAFRPTTVIVELGTNERLLNPDGTVNTAEVKALTLLYATLVKTIHAGAGRQRGADVKLIMCAAVQISPEDGTGLQARERAMNTLILAPLVAEYGPAGAGLIDAVVRFDDLGDDLIADDGIHPNAAGHAVRGGRWAEAGWGV